MSYVGKKTIEINGYNPNQSLENNYNTINRYYKYHFRTSSNAKFYNERNNNSSYSPLIKNANNILEIQNKPRTNENIYKDQRYPNNNRNEHLDEPYNNMNDPSDINYLENKYSVNFEESNKIENPNNSISSMKQDLDYNIKKISKQTPEQNINEFNKSIQNVENFSIKKDFIHPTKQEIINPQLNNSNQKIYNNDNYYQYLINRRSQNNNLQRKQISKNESFSNSVDHNNRNMIHLLRKY